MSGKSVVVGKSVGSGSGSGTIIPLNVSKKSWCATMLVYAVSAPITQPDRILEATPIYKKNRISRVLSHLICFHYCY